MDSIFTKHYTRDEARALLPQVQQWLEQLFDLRERLAKDEAVLSPRLTAGEDLGGATVNRQVRLISQLKDVLAQFAKREIQIKDLDRGLIDFPAFIGGREVFLCWEKGEEDIEFWHDLDTGYSGRERLK
jgi:hypothetical protein